MYKQSSKRREYVSAENLDPSLFLPLGSLISFFPFAIACTAVNKTQSDQYFRLLNSTAPQVDCVSYTGLHNSSVASHRPSKSTRANPRPANTSDCWSCLGDVTYKTLTRPWTSDPKKKSKTSATSDSKIETQTSLLRNLKNFEAGECGHRTELDRLRILPPAAQ